MALPTCHGPRSASSSWPFLPCTVLCLRRCSSKQPENAQLLLKPWAHHRCSVPGGSGGSGGSSASLLTSWSSGEASLVLLPEETTSCFPGALCLCPVPASCSGPPVTVGWSATPLVRSTTVPQATRRHRRAALRTDPALGCRPPGSLRGGGQGLGVSRVLVRTLQVGALLPPWGSGTPPGLTDL